MSDTKSNNTRLGFFSALTILFIALKLTNYITWSWWFVLGPLWIPVSVVIAGFILWIPINAAYEATMERRRENKNLDDAVKALKDLEKTQNDLRQVLNSNARDN